MSPSNQPPPVKLNARERTNVKVPFKIWGFSLMITSLELKSDVFTKYVIAAPGNHSPFFRHYRSRHYLTVHTKVLHSEELLQITSERSTVLMHFTAKVSNPVQSKGFNFEVS